MLSYFYIYFSSWKENKVCNYIPCMSKPKQIYKRAFLTERGKEREREREKSPELSHPSFRHLPEMTDLETCWIPETWGITLVLWVTLTTCPGSSSYQGQPGPSSPANLDGASSVHQAEQGCTCPQRWLQRLDFGSLTQHSTPPTHFLPLVW